MTDAAVLKQCLDSLAAGYGADHLDSDPVGLVHDFSDPLDIETAGFIAASLAYGGAAQIRRSVSDALDRLDRSPGKMTASCSQRELIQRFDGFKHRWTDGGDMADALSVLGGIIRELGSVGHFIGQIDQLDQPTIECAMTAFAARFAAEVGPSEPRRTPGRSRSYLVPSPANGSACKRLAMYFRWMVRGPDAIDFGLWKSIDPARLIIPVDRHIARMGKLLGLTQRNAADWKMALEISQALRKIDPSDPIRYDFALVRPGILRECTERTKGDCTDCDLKAVCREAR